jgi:hypothetical protein
MSNSKSATALLGTRCELHAQAKLSWQGQGRCVSCPLNDEGHQQTIASCCQLPKMVQSTCPTAPFAMFCCQSKHSQHTKRYGSAAASACLYPVAAKAHQQPVRASAAGSSSFAMTYWCCRLAWHQARITRWSQRPQTHSRAAQLLH